MYNTIPRYYPIKVNVYAPLVSLRFKVFHCFSNINAIDHYFNHYSDTGDRRRVVIVRFNRVTLRDGVIRARRRLRNNDSTEPIYINEDLTQRRAALAAATRQMKKTHKINDC